MNRHKLQMGHGHG